MLTNSLDFVLLRMLTGIAPCLLQELTLLVATGSVVFEGLPTGPCLSMLVVIPFLVILSLAVSTWLLHSDDFQVVVSGYQYIKMPIIFYYRYSLIFFFVLQLAYCSDLMKKLCMWVSLNFPSGE